MKEWDEWKEGIQEGKGEGIDWWMGEQMGEKMVWWMQWFIDGTDR